MPSQLLGWFQIILKKKTSEADIGFANNINILIISYRTIYLKRAWLMDTVNTILSYAHFTILIRTVAFIVILVIILYALLGKFRINFAHHMFLVTFLILKQT